MPTDRRSRQALLCYTMRMDRFNAQKLLRAWLPYPLAVQCVIVLALLGAPLSAIGVTGLGWRFWTVFSLSSLLLVASLLVPARRMPLWAQLLYLVVQLATTAVIQALVPVPLLGYVYLAIVFQAMALFRPWLWIPFAVAVYAVWSGLLFASGVVTWLQNNLALAFPVTCAIIAAIVYLRQQRRSEQVQQLLQQVQQRYDTLATALRDLQQHTTLEERSRLADTMVREVQAALSRAEQTATTALSQAQSNLSRLQSTVAQTRGAAAGAVERLRNTLAAIRLGDETPAAPTPRPGGSELLLATADEAVLSATPLRVLTWVLPGVFVALALGITLLSHWPHPLETVAPLAAGFVLLLTTYAVTQRTRNPLLFQTGVAGQIVVVVGMTAFTHTLPLLLGLLLVLWQLATRLPLRQILIYLAGVPAALTLAIARIQPWPEAIDALLMGAMTMVAVGAPLLLARRHLERRKQAERQVALLSAEIDTQTTQVRTLAVAAERSRLAREVHDDLGSRLILINLQLQLAEELATEAPEAALEQLRGSRELLHEAWRSVLSVVDAELPLAEGNLHAALAQLTAPVGHSPTVFLSVDGELDLLPAAVASTVYRVVQEGLTNARKHAQASRVDILVVAIADFVTVTITNDARPGNANNLAPRLPPAAGSFGLIGLRERAEALGGRLEAGPTETGGWRLRAVLPAEGV